MSPRLPHRGQRLLVTPRVGTESPWSSKATDILHVCGLKAVTRVERGTVYFVDSIATLGHAELQQLAAHLHDRMTESIWIDSIDPQGLFHGAAARPLRPRPIAIGAWRYPTARSATWWRRSVN